MSTSRGGNIDEEGGYNITCDQNSQKIVKSTHKFER